MAKKGARVQVTLEHKTETSSYRYYTTKNRRNTTERLTLRKYSPITKKHELFKEIK
jgi:large subunit ribosomal protein L33